MEDDELAALERQLLETLGRITQLQEDAATIARRILAENERRRSHPQQNGTVHPIRPEAGDE